MGLLLPGPGKEAFQRMFFPGPHWSGALDSCATSFPNGPRNAGQSPATAETASAQRKLVQAQRSCIVRFSFITGEESFDDSWSGSGRSLPDWPGKVKASSVEPSSQIFP